MTDLLITAEENFPYCENQFARENFILDGMAVNVSFFTLLQAKALFSKNKVAVQTLTIYFME